MLATAVAFIGTVSSSKTYRYQLAFTTTTAERPRLHFYSTEYLKDFASEVAIKYGLGPTVSQEMMATIQCESSWSIDPPHNNISWGIAQFTPATWKEFGYGDIMNPQSQLTIMAKMWHNGLENRWDCWRLKLIK